MSALPRARGPTAPTTTSAPLGAGAVPRTLRVTDQPFRSRPRRPRGDERASALRVTPPVGTSRMSGKWPRSSRTKLGPRTEAGNASPRRHRPATRRGSRSGRGTGECRDAELAAHHDSGSMCGITRNVASAIDRPAVPLRGQHGAGPDAEPSPEPPIATASMARRASARLVEGHSNARTPPSARAAATAGAWSRRRVGRWRRPRRRDAGRDPGSRCRDRHAVRASLAVNVVSRQGSAVDVV